METIEFTGKNGLKVVFLRTNKFKTVHVNLFLIDKIDYQNTTNMIFLTRLLRGANAVHPTVKDFSSYLKGSYDMRASVYSYFLGDTSVICFSSTGINSNFLFDKININERLFSVISEMLYNPLANNNQFRENYFLEQKRIYKELLDSNRDYKENVVEDKVNEILGKDTPFGVFKEGDIMDLPKINPQDSYQQYLTLFNKEPYLYVMGALEENEVKEYVDKYLDLSSKRVIIESIYRKEIYKKDNQEIPSHFKQSSFASIYSLPIYATDTLFTATQVFIEMLNYYLFKIIREENNFCYSIGARYNPYIGKVKIVSNIESVNYDKTLQLIDQIINDFNNLNDYEILKMAILKQINKHNQVNDSSSSLIEIHFQKSLLKQQLNIDEECEKIKSVKLEEVKKVASMLKYKFSLILKEKKDNE